MPQGPLAGAPDSFGNPVAMYQTRGGALTKLNVTAAAIVKAGKGRVARLVITGAGTGGSWTLNDIATTGAAAAANAVWTLAGTAAAGTVIDLDWPCTNGIVISSVPTGGTPSIAVSYR